MDRKDDSEARVLTKKQEYPLVVKVLVENHLLRHVYSVRL
jgi:hypothetical protein